MPQAVAGAAITSSAQINPSVVESSDILNDTIVDADINSAAAIAGSKLQALVKGTNAGVIPSTGIADAHVADAAAIAQSKVALSITNTEVNASAAIADTKLAQIVTASKVSGAAITLLTSLPAAAGVIPSANLPSPMTIAFPGTQVATAVGLTTTFADLDLSAVVGANRAMVLLKVTTASPNYNVGARPNGDTDIDGSGTPSSPSIAYAGSGNATQVLWVMTGTDGIIEWKVFSGSVNANAWVSSYMKIA